jgi:hypothetical protein
MPNDTIDLRMNGLDIKLSPEYISSKRDPSRTFRMMGITGNLGSTDITYKDDFAFKGQSIYFTAKNSTNNGDVNDEQKVRRVEGDFNAKLLQLNDSEGTNIKFENTKNVFKMRPKRGQSTIPVLNLSNTNQRITYITADSRIILTDSHIGAEAAMNTINRGRRIEAELDSLATIYPDVSRDSLRIIRRSLKRKKGVESWMIEEDFKTSDIKFDINKSIRKYVWEWEINCSTEVRTGIIMTPYFPLRNIIKGADLKIDNESIIVKNFKVSAKDPNDKDKQAKESEICINGAINQWKRAIAGRENIVNLDLDISSGSINADELLEAYNRGSLYEPKNTGSAKEMTNAEFFKQVTTDTVTHVQSTPSLVVIPGNLNADIKINTSGIKYKDLDISSFTSQMLIKQRCAKLTGTSMRSNMGDFDLDAFYATRSKQDIKTGFCLDVKDVTSERVIGLVPEVDQLLPMIGSIEGLLNCEIAATASLDTTMSLMMPTVNGIARMSGKSLKVSDDELYTSVARKLMFKNKKEGKIDSLKVEGSIKDNRLEVYPFIIKLDRYTLGVGGVQNMDMSFKHHISVLRSPILIRLGLNLSGPDYDNIKFKLGKALYKPKKVDSFTNEIDSTKVVLKKSIDEIFETGVEKTIQNTDMQSHIAQRKLAIGYVNAAEMEMEELSEKDLKKLEESEATENAMEEAIANIVAAVQEVLKNK